MSMNWISILVDLLLVAVFVFCVVFFSKHGLDGALNKISKIWLAFLFALFIGPEITAFLENVWIRDAITNGVHQSLLDLITHNPNGYNLYELFRNLPEGFVQFLDGLGASLEALEAEFGSYTDAGPEIIEAMAHRIATPCINVLSGIIGYFLGIIIPWLILKWLEKELHKDSKHKFFKVTDHIAGFFTGAILGYGAILGLALLTRTTFQVIIAFDASYHLMDIYQSSFIFRFLGEFDSIGAIKTVLGALSDALAAVAQ